MKTIEQKAKAYDEALKVLHKYDGANIMFSQSLKEEMFPELAESEDERIRREIRDFICWSTDKGCITKEQVEKSNSWLAWLVSPVLSNSSNIGKDEQTCPDIEEAIKEVEEKAKAFTEAHKGESSDDILAQMRGEQKPAWSMRDEGNLYAVIFLATKALGKDSNVVNWLKSLKDRVQPKPAAWSEEDIEKEWRCYSRDGECAVLNKFSFWLIAKHFSSRAELEWNENDEVALESASLNYAKDKHPHVQTAVAFMAGARWVLQR